MIPSIDVPKESREANSGCNNNHDHIGRDKDNNDEEEDDGDEAEEEKEAEAKSGGEEAYEAIHDFEPSLLDEPMRHHHKHCATFEESYPAFYSELIELPSLVEKSVIIHRDENGFGLLVKGQAPIFVEHVHENGAAWRAGVRRFDQISKLNGLPVSAMDHKDVVLMFKSCSRFVGITLLSSITGLEAEFQQQQQQYQYQYEHHIKSSPSSAFHFKKTAAPNQKHSLIKSLPLNFTSSQPLQIGCFSSTNFMEQDSKSTAPEEELANYKLMLAKRYSNSHSCNLLLNRRDSSNDSSREILFAKQTGKLSKSSTLSTHSAYPTNQMISQQQQLQLLQARRSESVSVKTNYQSVKRCERRTSDSEICDNLVICIGCSPLEQEQTTRDFCVECKQVTKLGHLVRQTSSGQLMSNQQRQHHHHHYDHSESYRQSFLNSSRHYQAPRQHQIDIRVTNSTNNSNRNINTIDAPHFAHANLSSQNEIQNTFYKLTQSPSTNSLPADESMNKNTNSPAPSSQSFTPFSALNKQQQQPAQINKRLEIIKEFIDTEKTHTDRLRYLDELFYRPLKNGAFMTGEQLRMVFSCHRTLYRVHRQIYRILLSANYNLYSEPMIGSALLEIFESDLKRRLEKAACTFCVAQSTNAELLNKLTRRDTKVGEFIAQVTSQQMVGRLGIKDLLASCFQRLTKYPLLLENLLKATPQPKSVEVVVARKRHLSIRSNQLDLTKETTSDSKQSNEGKGEEEKKINNDEEKAEAEEEESEEPVEVKNSRRMLAISLAEEREFIERALYQSRQILIKVNDSVKVAMSHNKLKEIWKRTDKYPGVPLIDITKQQVVHEGLLTLRLSKRSFDVYVLLLNDYIIILTREGQDKYRLKFFTPDGKSSTNSQTVYSPVFVIDEHLTTRDAATDENGFYLLCKRKDDSRIYEFASRSPAERLKWRDRIQWTIERQMIKTNRRPSSKFSSC